MKKQRIYNNQEAITTRLSDKNLLRIGYTEPFKKYKINRKYDSKKHQIILEVVEVKE